ncbi:MAG TPA: hypothetical protein VFQ53_39460 [Kofleriaceae bacterium]|nr:hypothetical protein [Kofleriaceae bacterium]
MLALLPILSVASPVVVDGHEQLERALSDGVRAAVAQGWTLTAVGPEDDAIVFTLSRNGEVVRHVAKLDGTNSYYVEPGAAPEWASAPSTFMMLAMRAKRGGVELESECGGFYERPYVVDAFEVGDASRKLVAKTLASAVDLESAYTIEGGRVVFDLELADGKASELVVHVDGEGRVVEAEQRRYEYATDDSTYRRMTRLKKLTKGGFVTAIDTSEGELVLVTNKGRFRIDPDGDAFESTYDPEDEGGCGC